MIELQGKEVLSTEEIQVDADEDGKSVRRKKKMECYDPIVFEECYVKHRGLERIANSFELDNDKELACKIDPTIGRRAGGFEGVPSYTGMHLFVMCHGFQGSSFDMRNLKNVISISLPDAIFLQSTSNENKTDGDIIEMGTRLANEVHTYIRENCPGN